MMNKNKRQAASRQIPLKWLWILLVQLVSCFAIAIPGALSMWLGGTVHGICSWVLLPVAGFISACLATRKGLLNYAAWILPPLVQLPANLLVWGYLPTPGPILLCAFISLVGAATGEVLKRQKY